MSDELRITQKETVKTKHTKIDVITFNTATAMIVVDYNGGDARIHLTTAELLQLGEAIQRIAAGEDRYHDQCDEPAPIMVGS